jgi:uncharacterized protein
VLTSVPEANNPLPRVRPWRLRLQGWLRWLHIYTSMLSLIVVLFFSVTGITLNHPDWLFGTQEIRSESTGTLPANWRNGKTVDWFVVAEHIRAAHSAKGKAIDQQSTDTDASLRFAAPGYTADALIEQNGNYTLRVSSQGWVAVLNDFHRGRNAGLVWAVLIDVAGWFLVLISLTGLGLLLYLKKIRFKALVVMALGGVLMIVLMQWLG